MQIRKSFVFLLVSLFLVSCDKEDNAGGGGSDSFECSIDGSAHKIS
jgi:hypothetical protein